MGFLCPPPSQGLFPRAVELSRLVGQNSSEGQKLVYHEDVLYTFYINISRCSSLFNKIQSNPVITTPVYNDTRL